MATNKHATIRYNTLDKCFSNAVKRYYMDDLIEVCNEALYDFSGTDTSIKKRQVFDDLRFMESTEGWSIPLERYKDGRRVYYRYSEKDFSIKKQVLSSNEISSIQQSLAIISRFSGMEQFEWVQEANTKLTALLGLKHNGSPAVSFEQNPYLQGLEYFSQLFDSINHQTALRIMYQGHNQEEPNEVEFHPYFIKQYNSRFFVFGYNPKYDNISNLAFDRIKSIEICSSEYMSNQDIDFDQYFEDIIGVTVPDSSKVQRVLIRVDSRLYKYLQTKPLHGSQKVVLTAEEYVDILLEVHLNYELESLLLSHGERLEILEPETLRSSISERVSALTKKYK